VYNKMGKPNLKNNERSNKALKTINKPVIKITYPSLI
jgi:hypothetical protein